MLLGGGGVQGFGFKFWESGGRILLRLTVDDRNPA